MVNMVWSGFFALSLMKLTLQIAMSMKGETLVKRYDKLHLNCSTDTVPVGNAADIKVNEKSFTIVTLSNDKCYSTVLGKECVPDICECSTNGLWFTHVYQANESEGFVDFKCSMTFGSHGPLFDHFQLRIIDFTGPMITTNVLFPVFSGSKVQFVCMVETTVHIISFKWDCLGKVKKDQVTRSTQHTSVIVREVHVRHDNQRCECSANVDGISKTTSNQIKIRKNPSIRINDSLSCNRFSSVILYCSILTELNNYGFNRWKHSVRGTFLRTVNGENHNKQSSLPFGSCSYQDAGEYECIAWSEHAGVIFYANETVSLSVNHPPVIISANAEKDNNVNMVKLIVIFYSLTYTTTTWFQHDQQILNSSKMLQTLDGTAVQLTFYNHTIKCDGFVVSVAVRSVTFSEKYVLVLKNGFGETRQALYVDSNFNSGNSFDIRSVIIGITAICIFILTATFTAILSRGRQCSNIIHIIGPHERSPTVPVYHSAPGCDNNYHTYEGINPAYLDAIDNGEEDHNSEVEYDEPDVDITPDHYEEID